MTLKWAERAARYHRLGWDVVWLSRGRARGGFVPVADESEAEAFAILVGGRTGLVALQVSSKAGEAVLGKARAAGWPQPYAPEARSTGKRYLFFRHTGEPFTFVTGPIGPGLRFYGDYKYVPAPDGGSAPDLTWTAGHEPEVIALPNLPYWLLLAALAPAPSAVVSEVIDACLEIEFVHAQERGEVPRYISSFDEVRRII